jgi:hypothetical protein
MNISRWQGAITAEMATPPFWVISKARNPCYAKQVRALMERAVADSF